MLVTLTFKLTREDCLRIAKDFGLEYPLPTGALTQLARRAVREGLKLPALAEDADVGADVPGGGAR